MPENSTSFVMTNIPEKTSKLKKILGNLYGLRTWVEYGFRQWNHQTGWRNVLNNFRLIIQLTLLLWLIFPWLEIFPNSSLLLGLYRLIHTMNQFQPLLLSG
jgi:hypothetical protein